MDDSTIKLVTDLAALKIVAHPLRARLLGALRMHGPATASELGRRFDESSGSTSYHLRELAKHDFVELDPEQHNARDKRWRATARYTSWRNSDFGDVEGREATRALRGNQTAFLIDKLERHDAAVDELEDVWRDTLAMSDYAAELSPESVRELQRRTLALVEELREKDRGRPDTRFVRLYLAALIDPDDQNAP